MDDRAFEEMLERVLRQDFSQGTEAFREDLLARCLAQLDADSRASELEDDELELLAAAGDPATLRAVPDDIVPTSNEALG